MKNLKILLSLLLISSLIWSCKEEEMEPLADFSYKVKDLEVTFTNLSYDATSFTWDFGDGNQSSEIQATHTYEESGEYQVTLIASGKKGTDKVTKQIELNQKASITIDGDFSDWKDITPIVCPEDATYKGIKELRVTSNKLFIFVYGKLDVTTKPNGLSVYVDRDLSEETGCVPWILDGGVELLLQAEIGTDGEMFQFIGTDGSSEWAWEPIVSSGSGLFKWSEQKTTGDEMEFELSLTREMFPKLRDDYVGLTFYLENNRWETQGVLPIVGSKPLKLNLKTGVVEIK